MGERTGVKLSQTSAVSAEESGATATTKSLKKMKSIYYM